MESFDPFAQWLGRPSGRPPADHYELLGLPRFEPDLELIAQTADTLRTKIRKIRPGPHVAQWQRLLDRLESAKICFSDPIAKAAYDESIDTASHTLNVSGEPVVTWDSASEEFGGLGPTPHEAAGTTTSGDESTGPSAASMPEFIEAPPVVASLDADQRGTGQQGPTETDFQPVRPIARKSKGSRLAVRLLFACAVLLAVAVGLALWKQRRDAMQTAGTSRGSSQVVQPAELPSPELDENPETRDPSIDRVVQQSPPRNDAPEPPVSASGGPEPASAPPPPGPAPGTPPAFPAPTTPSIATIDPARQQAFRRAVSAVRSALADRDLEAAGSQLNEAASLSQTDEDRAEADRLEVLRAHLEAFWGSLRQLIPKLESGSEFQVGQAMVIVVETGPDFLELRAAGRKHRYSIEGMPHALAVAMAEQLFSKSSNAKALRAAFLIVEPDGNAERARQLLQEVAQDGSSVDELLEELNESRTVEQR